MYSRLILKLLQQRRLVLVWGYVPIGDDGTPGNYAYDADYVNDITDTEWVTKKLYVYFDRRTNNMFGCYEP